VHRRATARRVLSALHPAAAAAAKTTNGQHTIRLCPDGNRSNSAELGKRTAGSGEGIHMPAEKRERERESERIKNDTRVSGWPEGGRCAGAASGLDFRICGYFLSQEAACAGATGTVTPASRQRHLTYFSSGPSTLLCGLKKYRFSLTDGFRFSLTPSQKLNISRFQLQQRSRLGGVGLHIATTHTGGKEAALRSPLAKRIVQSAAQRDLRHSCNSH
jgi:hypothetical protein